MELQVRSAADLEAGRSQRELLVHVGWFESACPICHWCYAACASWLRRLCCACARTGRAKAAPGRWTSAEGEPLTLDYGLGGGGCMWACAAVSLFFTLCGAALFVWEYEQCEELTFSELFMGAECDAVLDGSAGSSAELLSAELPAGALACETDYDCEITGACNATSGTCEYEDERLTKGPFLLLGGVSALLAAVCGGTRGGWKREVLEILPQPEGEGEGWTLRISERKWAPFCGRVDRPVSDLPPTARADVKKITLTSRERVLGYTVTLDGLYVPDAEPDESDVVWHGQPLERWEAEEIATRINDFLGVKPDEPAVQPRRRGPPATSPGSASSRRLAEGVPGEGRRGQQAVRSPRSRRRPVSPAPRPEHLSSRHAESTAPARTASQDSWNSRTVAEATERHASAAVVAGEHELLQVQIDEARHVSRHDIAGIWVAFFSRCQRYRCWQDDGAANFTQLFTFPHAPDWRYEVEGKGITLSAGEDAAIVLVGSEGTGELNVATAIGVETGRIVAKLDLKAPKPWREMDAIGTCVGGPDAGAERQQTLPTVPVE